MGIQSNVVCKLTLVFSCLFVLLVFLPEASAEVGLDSDSLRITRDARSLLSWFNDKNMNGGEGKYLFIHTTDIHGWIGQHRHNAVIDTDLGDFVSLVTRLREAAEEAGVNLFVGDTGDLIFGTGLSDASEVHGQYVLPIIADVPYDAMTMGNHDMDEEEAVVWLQANFLPQVSERYLTSNTLWADAGDFFGTPYFVHTFPDGSRALVLGFIFYYPRASDKVETIKVPESVLQEYFQRAMEEPDIDLVIVLGHIDPLARTEMNAIFEAVHEAHPNLPFVFLGGHRHITYFGEIDENSYAIESGRYLETIGTISMTLDPDSGAIAEIEHEFIKATLENYRSAAGVDELDTPEGDAIKARIAQAEAELGLDVLLGCSDRLWTKYTDFDADDALWGLFFREIVPENLIDQSRANPQVFVANFYSIRSNLFPGEVLNDDIYSLVPFLDDVQSFADVPGSIVKQVYGGLRMNKPSKKSGFITFMSSIPEEDLDDDTLYDFVAQDYDSRTIGEYLEKYSGAPWPRDVYTGPYNAHDAIKEYVKAHWDC